MLTLFISKGRQEDCLTQIVNSMKGLGIEIERCTKQHTKIMESEVTKESISSMDIRQILSHIQDYETEVSNYDLSISTVQTLSTLYQKAIEYYSALDDFLNTNEFLGRMQQLLAREDVDIVLKSVEEESKYHQLINNIFV